MEQDPIDLTLNRLAKQLQRTVPEQPWGRTGAAPVPLEVFFDANNVGNEWRVRWVASVTGEKRNWKSRSGHDLITVIRDALGTPVQIEEKGSS